MFRERIGMRGFQVIKDKTLMRFSPLCNGCKVALNVKINEMKQNRIKVSHAFEVPAVVGCKTIWVVGTIFLKGFLTKAKRKVRIIPEGSVIKNILDIIRIAAVGVGGLLVNVARTAVLGYVYHSWVS
jgi:hypothetical protein